MGRAFGGKTKWKNPFSGLFTKKKKKSSFIGRRQRTLGERAHAAVKSGARIIHLGRTIGGRVQLASDVGLLRTRRTSFLGGKGGGQSHAKPPVRRTNILGQKKKTVYIPRFWGNQYIKIGEGGRVAKKSPGKKASLVGRK
jgi:hypothetical protein